MSCSEESVSEFWHKNFTEIPSITDELIDFFSAEVLSIKATLTRGYKFFYESYIHDVEGNA